MSKIPVSARYFGYFFTPTANLTLHFAPEFRALMLRMKGNRKCSEGALESLKKRPAK
jgi:hypothetical protein